MPSRQQQITLLPATLPKTKKGTWAKQAANIYKYVELNQYLSKKISKFPFHRAAHRAYRPIDGWMSMIAMLWRNRFSNRSTTMGGGAARTLSFIIRYDLISLALMRRLTIG